MNNTTSHYIFRKHIFNNQWAFDIDQENLCYADFSPSHHGLQCNFVGGTDQHKEISSLCSQAVDIIKKIDSLNNPNQLQAKSIKQYDIVGFQPKKYIKEHADFKKYFDASQKRNIWVLGYFGGGSVNILEAYEFAKEYAKQIGTPLDTVKIDEILSSRRFKGFKLLYSQTLQDKDKDAIEMDNVHQYLRD